MDMHPSVRMPSSLRNSRAETLVRNIAKYIDSHSVTSLLDIGAGYDSIATPLSQLVSRYLAVEQDTSRAAVLRKCGLNVVCGRFPISLSEVFDMVLSCHSVPEGNIDSYNPFLDSAWEAVRTGGILLVITFKGGLGDGILLRQEITGRMVSVDPQFEAIVRNLRTKGDVLIKRVNSYLRSSDAEGIVTYLKGWVLRTDEEMHDHGRHLREILEARYNKGGEYKFPMQHLFISAVKKKMQRC